LRPVEQLDAPPYSGVEFDVGSHSGVDIRCADEQMAPGDNISYKE
jgi:hypothetical protein